MIFRPVCPLCVPPMAGPAGLPGRGAPPHGAAPAYGAAPVHGALPGAYRIYARPALGATNLSEIQWNIMEAPGNPVASFFSPFFQL